MVAVAVRVEAVELRVLGPVEVHAGGRVLGSGRPQQQVVLAALAVEAGRLVSADALLDRLSGQAQPKRATQLLHTHITRIRRLLEQAQAAGGASVRLARRAGGYLLELPRQQVDLHRFHHLVGRAAAGDCPAANRVGLLGEALDLWRGEPLAGLSGPWVEATRQVWRQQRLAAVLAWSRSTLEAGEPAAVIDPLVRELAEQPLVEPLAAVLMRALAVTGRGSEALAYYAAVRRRLAEDLGTDPGAELQTVHRAILRGEPATPARFDPAAPTPVPAPAPAPLRRPVPAELPADVPAFTGREPELEQLDALLDAGCRPAAPDPAGDGGDRRQGRTEMAIAVVVGTAGVGKTALAVRWAHRVADRFPDGQLYVNLRGFDPEQPMTAVDALARFLTALGVTGRDIPPEPDERAARYRSEVAGRRMLIVLDNAASGEQVRPLLPGTGSCAVLVTSRDSLAGLVAVHGARRLDLDLLPTADALALLRRLVGARVEVDPDAATALVHRCVRLPLALRVAAELVVSRPGSPLGGLVDELADRQQRLCLLDAGGDPRAAVGAVFSWSLQQLPAEAARVFRLLGGHPGDDFDAYAVAALAGLGLARARRSLDRLARAHLVHPTPAGRYHLHDLLRAYAMQLSQADDSERERRAAVGRLLSYQLAAAAVAVDRLNPAEALHLAGIPRATTPVPELAGADAARRWLDAERPCLVAVAGHAAAHGWPGHAVALAGVLDWYLDGGHHADALALHAHAHEAARRAGNPAGQSHALRGLGAAHLRLGRYGSAVDHYERALALSRSAGDELGEIRALNGLGLVEVRLGRYAAAADHHRQALARCRRAGDRLDEVRALNGLGLVEQRRGRYGAAVHHHQAALVLARRIGDRIGEAVALDNLGIVEHRLGRPGVAAERHGQSLALVRALGNRTGEGHVLDNLGSIHLGLGQPTNATEHFRHALLIFREIGDREGEATALNGLGEAASAAGRPADAVEHHTAALAIASAIGDGNQQAQAHTGLGEAHRALADPTRARQHYLRGMALYRGLESPEAGRLREHVAALGRAEQVLAGPVEATSE
jgi:DNA-binding SARP family transcriptional activator/tetratricopeptide (TPR) repeat protein